MKKHYNFKAFTQGAKALVAILFVAVMAVGNVFAEGVTHVFSERGFTNTKVLEKGTINDNSLFVAALKNGSYMLQDVEPAVTPWTATFDDPAENAAWNIDNSGANNTNKWYIGQAQGFNDNKLYISSSNGVTNKYNATVSSVVRASRAIVIPAAGAVLSFDYRVNGKAGNDYLQVMIEQNGDYTTLAKLSNTNVWTTTTFVISPDMAGDATLVFMWANQGNGGEQFPAAIDNVSLIETPCSQPVSLLAMANGTTATVSWTGDAEAYLLQYKLVDHSEWYSVNTTENTVVLNNLQGNSNYNVRVQSVCGDDASAWVEGNFVVGCQNLEEITSTEDVVIGNGTSTQRYLFNGYYGFGYSANLYTMTKAGTIHSIAFYQSSPESSTGASLDLWVKAVPADYALAVSNTFNSMLEGAQQICSGISDFSTSGWKVFNIEGGFTLEEGQNLLVLSKAKGCTTGGGCTKYVRYTSSSNKVWYKEADNNDPGQNVSGSLSSYLPNITINMDVTTIVCGDVEACPAVTDLNVENITPNSAELTWAAGNEDETNFLLEYKQADEEDWMPIEVNATSYNLTNLVQKTDYMVRVRAICGENNESILKENAFTTPGICASVTEVASSNSSNSTTLTWTPSGEETAWLVQFKPSEAGDNEWISINVNALPTTTFGGLMATTEYNVRVKALCDPADEENQSVWTTYEFISGCAAIDAPYSETFDSYSMPTCWDADGFGFSGAYAYSSDLNAWIMTPAINIPSDETTYLAFDVKGYGNFSVMASYRGTDASRFAEIYSGEIESGSNYTQVVVPMADNLKGRQVYFKIVNNADQYQYIDNLSIDYCPLVPANLTVSNITENSATLAWTADEAVSNFQVKVGENIIDVEGAKTYTLTGLNASTTYTFFVRTQCGEDSYGDWSAEKTFTTPCPSVTLPYTEDFESTETYEFPACWTIVSSAMYNPPYVYSYSSYSQFTTNFLGLNYAAVVATPKIAAPANQLMLNFDFTQESTTYSSCGPIEVGFTTDLSSVENITWLQTINNSTNQAVEHKTVYFNTLNTDAQGYIVFRGQSSNYLLAIDNVLVETIPTCGTPTLAVNGTTATITPSTIGEPASYDLQIGNEIQTVPATETTVDLASIFTLAPQTTYSVSVRANCGEGDYSEWSAEESFTTPCMAEELPFVENFNTLTSGIPECWDNSEGSATVASYKWNCWNGGKTGACVRFDSYNNSTDITNFLKTPAVVLSGNATLTFSYKNPTGGDFSVYIESNGQRTLLASGLTGQSSWKEKTYDLTAYTGQEVVVIFKGTSNWGYGDAYIYLDDITIQAPPTCGTPTLAVNGTTATITPKTPGTPESYELKIGEETRTVPETETTVDLASIFTLAPSTTYSVSVRANCGGGDHSEWSQAVSFMTPCAAYTVPYFEGFENGYTDASAVAGCISQQSVSGSYSWIANSSQTSRNRTPRTGSWNAYLQWSNTKWMYIPMHFEANKHYVFEMYARQDVSTGCSMKVAYGTDNTSSAMTNTIVSSTNIGSSFVKLTGTFAPTAAGDYYIGIYAELNSTPYYVSIDDISITEEPFCVKPNVASVVPGTTNATVTVAASENAQSYEVVCVLHGENIETGTPVAADELTAIITGLTPATQYDVYARAICSETEISDWSEVSTFSTECLAYTLPYFEGFENNTFAPDCWQNYHVSGPGTSLWQRESYTVHTGTGSAKIPDMSATTITNLVSPALVIPQANTCKVSVWVNRNAAGTGKANEGVKVYASTTGAVDETAVELFHAHRYIGFEPVQSTTGWYEYEAMIPISGESVYLIFQGICEYGNATYIDDITVEQVVFEKDLAINSIDPIAWACDQSDAKVTIHVENTGSAATITSFVANYAVNTQSPVHETVNCNLAPGETMSYTFNATPVFQEGTNTVYAYVEMEGDMKEENNNVDPIIVKLLEPETVPYTPALSANLVNKGWNVVDANNDGITMDINTKSEIVYTFNDTLDANDWMFTPCIEMPAGTYNVYYEYKANSSLNEKFEVFYGAGANVAAMTNEVANHNFNNTDYETVIQTITVAEDGIYNFGLHATSLAGNLGFSIANFKIYPVIDITVTSGENGTVTPNGVVPVNYGENLNVTIVPNTMYHVAGVWVDDVQVMSEDPYNSNFMIYTLENVTAPHRIFVDYKLEYHIIKSVANYNPAYTDVPGTFVPAATDTLIDPNPVTVNFAAAPHYHLYSLEMAMTNEEDMVDVTADVVDNGDHTYSYTTGPLVVANYYLKATFRKDTVNVHYNILTGKGYADASDLLVAPVSYDSWIDYGTDYTASITPADGYYLIDVNNAGPVADYQINNVTEQSDVNVQFGHKVTAQVTNYYGTPDLRGTIAPATSFVPEGESLTLNGTVEEHFHLESFLINGVEYIQDVTFNNDGTYSYTFAEVMDNYDVNAIVRIDTVAIFYTVDAGQGTIDDMFVVSNETAVPAHFAHYVDYSSRFLATFTPAIGYHVVNVNVNGVDYGPIPSWDFVNVTEAQHAVVTFAPNTYEITTTAIGHGTVSEGATFVYNPDNTYTFTATPDEGYVIDQILRNNTELFIANPSATFTQTLSNILSDYNYVVNFVPATYTVEAFAGNNGNITPVGTSSYNYGEAAEYVVTANTGYYISSVTVDGETTTYTQADERTSFAETFTFSGVDASNHTISATFAAYRYTVEVAAGDHGSINPGTTTYNYNTTPTFTITPAAGYGVADVTVDGESVGAVTSYTFPALTANHTIAATFAQYQYTITANAGNGGSIAPAGVMNMIAGGDQTYNITAATGYHIANVFVDGASVGAVSTYSFNDINANHTIYASFAVNEYTVTVNQPNHGTITPGTTTVTYQATPTFVITPNMGYNVTAITVNGTNVIANATNNNGVYTYTLPAVTANVTLTATMTQKTFTITASAGNHGTIAPAGTTTVNFGANATYTFTPATGYEVENVTVDGMTMGAVTSYTFTNVVANHTISATFKLMDCAIPTNMHTTNITSSSATFDWYHQTATSFEVQYKALNAATFTSVAVNDNVYEVAGLTPGTTYVWMVRANCGNNNYSEWSNGNLFTTLAEVPEYDGVEDYSVKDLVKVYASNNNVYIVNNAEVQIENVQIYDVYGKLLYSGNVTSNTEVISMNVATGTYVVRLTTAQGTANYKVYLTK